MCLCVCVSDESHSIKEGLMIATIVITELLVRYAKRMQILI